MKQIQFNHDHLSHWMDKITLSFLYHYRWKFDNLKSDFWYSTTEGRQRAPLLLKQKKQFIPELYWEAKVVHEAINCTYEEFETSLLYHIPDYIYNKVHKSKKRSKWFNYGLSDEICGKNFRRQVKFKKKVHHKKKILTRKERSKKDWRKKFEKDKRKTTIQKWLTKDGRVLYNRKYRHMEKSRVKKGIWDDIRHLKKYTLRYDPYGWY